MGGRENPVHHHIRRQVRRGMMVKPALHIAARELLCPTLLVIDSGLERFQTRIALFTFDSLRDFGERAVLRLRKSDVADL
jgi:hypothetical protein